MKKIPHKINRIDNYFENIDSEEKAYFLGIMFSDGCIWKDKQGRKSIQLKMKDYDVIYNFKRAIKSDHIIRSEKDGYRLIFKSKKMFDDLEKLGCVPRKSLIVKFPVINKEFMWPFIFGVFDGDGYITKYNNTIYFSICSGSKEFIEDINSFYLSEGIIGSMNDREKINTYSISVGKRDYVIYIYKKLLQINIKTMERKRNIFNQYITESYGYDNTEITD